MNRRDAARPARMAPMRNRQSRRPHCWLGPRRCCPAAHRGCRRHCHCHCHRAGADGRHDVNDQCGAGPCPPGLTPASALSQAIRRPTRLRPVPPRGRAEPRSGGTRHDAARGAARAVTNRRGYGHAPVHLRRARRRVAGGHGVSRQVGDPAADRVRARRPGAGRHRRDAVPGVRRRMSYRRRRRRVPESTRAARRRRTSA